MRTRALPDGSDETVVMSGRRTDLRRVWVQVHLWLGLTLGVVGALIGVTGSVLVFDRAIDSALNPQRYATSGQEIALPMTDYAKRATGAAGEGARIVNLRLPATVDTPVVAFVRARDDAAPLNRIYLDPPSGRVLDAPMRRGLVGWTHDLHESLALREYNGRELVGVVGFATLVSSLSGIYLWWPRRRPARRDFTFRRAFPLSRNLHYTFGFYGSLVLSMLAFTGILLAFPEAGRVAVSVFASVSPSARGVQAVPSVGRAISPDDAVAVALAQFGKASVASVGFPAGARGVYRVALREPGDDSERGTAVIFVDPRSAKVLRQVDRATQTPGDAFLAFQRPLHEGDAVGVAGRIVISIVGLLPALFVVTGSMMWLRSRRRR